MRSLKEYTSRGSLLFPFQHYRMTNEEGQLFIPYHWHEELEILYCMEGNLSLMIGKNAFRLTKGDICFINREELHQFQSDDPSLIYYAYVFPLERVRLAEQDFLQARIIRPLVDRTLLFPARVPDTASCYTLIRQEIETIIQVNERKSTAYQLMTKAALLKIIAALTEEGLFCENVSEPADSGRESAVRIREISEWLKEHLSEPVTLDLAAKNFLTSPKYFSRSFKQLFHKNFSEYVGLLRTERACMLLLTTDDSIAEIASECGYDNPSYFIRKFREHTGKTPLHYRHSQESQL